MSPQPASSKTQQPTDFITRVFPWIQERTDRAQLWPTSVPVRPEDTCTVRNYQLRQPLRRYS